MIKSSLLLVTISKVMCRMPGAGEGKEIEESTEDCK
jgi:hypothetical protein